MPVTEAHIEDSLNDLIGNPPGWLLRSGLSAFFIVVVLVLVMAAFIRYPDKITSTGEMTSRQPPIIHNAMATGLIDSLYVQINEMVTASDTLLYIKNSASMTDMYLLREFIQTLSRSDSEQLYAMTFPSGLLVGDMQADYAALELDFRSFKRSVDQSMSFYKRQALEKELVAVRQKIEVLKKQKVLADQELSLSKKDFERTQWLHDQELISIKEYDQEKARHIQTEKQYLSLEKEIINENVRPAQLNNEINDLSQNTERELEQQYLKIRERGNVLWVNIQDWQGKYVITAKTEGQVLFGSEIVKNKEVQPGEGLVSIIPASGSSERFIKGLLPAAGTGKVNIGDKVLVKVVGYPHKEYGMLSTEVSYLAALPVTDAQGNKLYEIYYALPQGELITSYGVRIPFMPNTPVQVDVVTANKSLLARIFNQFLNLLKNT